MRPTSRRQPKSLPISADDFETLAEVQEEWVDEDEGARIRARK